MSRITRNIFISGVEELEKFPFGIHNVRYVVCCVQYKYLSDVYSKIMEKYHGLTVLFLPMDDSPWQNLFSTEGIQMINPQKINFESIYRNRPYVDVANHFINYAIQNGSNVLVHCMAGISRSVSTAIYYFMRTYNMSYEKALELIRSRRSIANPNIGFANQLRYLKNG